LSIAAEGATINWTTLTVRRAVYAPLADTV
jgi:hypothetical protein